MTEFTTSTLGWVYIALAAAWTLVLAGGLLYLFRHRGLPFLQIRRLFLVFSAVILLHLYAVVCMVSYTIHPIVPCDAQFWIMSVYLPFGIALLQAANSQFLYVAGQQRQYANFTNLDELEFSEKSTPINPSLPWWKRTIQRIQRMDKTTRTVIFIGIGIAVEVRLYIFSEIAINILIRAVGTHFICLFWVRDVPSQLWHLQCPSSGYRPERSYVPHGMGMVCSLAVFVRSETLTLNRWLSIAWQFFWAWIYAPYREWFLELFYPLPTCHLPISLLDVFQHLDVNF